MSKLYFFDQMNLSQPEAKSTESDLMALGMSLAEQESPNGLDEKAESRQHGWKFSGTWNGGPDGGGDYDF